MHKREVRIMDNKDMKAYISGYKIKEEFKDGNGELEVKITVMSNDKTPSKYNKLLNELNEVLEKIYQIS